MPVHGEGEGEGGEVEGGEGLEVASDPAEAQVAAGAALAAGASFLFGKNLCDTPMPGQSHSGSKMQGSHTCSTWTQ